MLCLLNLASTRSQQQWSQKWAGQPTKTSTVLGKKSKMLVEMGLPLWLNTTWNIKKTYCTTKTKSKKLKLVGICASSLKTTNNLNSLRCQEKTPKYSKIASEIFNVTLEKVIKRGKKKNWKHQALYRFKSSQIYYTQMKVKLLKALRV